MKTLSQVKSKIAPGVSMNILRLASNVAGAEQFVIGSDTYQIDIVNTDSTINTVAPALNATDTETTITMTAHGRKVGDLIRIENEIMRVKKVIDANTIEVGRGAAGTTVATHSVPQDIFISNAAPAASIIPVGLVTTLTPAAAITAIVDTINDMNAVGIVASTPGVNAVAIRTADGRSPANHPCTETLAGANNAWAAAAMYGSTLGDVRGSLLQARAANATEVALDYMLFDFPFTVAAAIVQIRTAAGALKTWDGAITFTGKRVTVGNAGAADWAATDVVTVLATE